jgi:hypothetical protein
MHLLQVRKFFAAMRRAIATVAMLAGTCCPALAVDHEVYRCNTANGKYDAQAFEIPSTSKTIVGKILFHKADFRGEWNSVVNISVAQSGSTDGSCHCSGMKLIAFPNPDKIEVRVTAGGIEKAIADTDFDFPVNFKIMIDEKGFMTTQLGTLHPLFNSIKLLHPEHNVLQMSCSGSDVSFFNIEVL